MRQRHWRWRLQSDPLRARADDAGGMDINDLLANLAILAGILLMAVLAVGPLWLAHQTERGERHAPTRLSRSSSRRSAPRAQTSRPTG